MKIKGTGINTTTMTNDVEGNEVAWLISTFGGLIDVE
jgi:hypothetical protein